MKPPVHDTHKSHVKDSWNRASPKHTNIFPQPTAISDLWQLICHASLQVFMSPRFSADLHDSPSKQHWINLRLVELFLASSELRATPHHQLSLTCHSSRLCTMQCFKPAWVGIDAEWLQRRCTKCSKVGGKAWSSKELKNTSHGRSTGHAWASRLLKHCQQLKRTRQKVQEGARLHEGVAAHHKSSGCVAKPLIGSGSLGLAPAQHHKAAARCAQPQQPFPLQRCHCINDQSQAISSQCIVERAVNVVKSTSTKASPDHLTCEVANTTEDFCKVKWWCSHLIPQPSHAKAHQAMRQVFASQTRKARVKHTRPCVRSSASIDPAVSPQESCHKVLEVANVLSFSWLKRPAGTSQLLAYYCK